MDNFFADPRTPILLDWIGSLLMAGSLWGWVYKRLEEPLHERWARAEMKHAFVRHKYNYFYADGFDERKRRGKELRASGISRESQEWAELDSDTDMGMVAWMKSAPSFIKSLLPLLFYDVIFRVTETVFVGLVSKLMFAAGFIMWNCSRALPLFYPR